LIASRQQPPTFDGLTSRRMWEGIGPPSFCAHFISAIASSLNLKVNTCQPTSIVPPS
jgi:hypothetical protein